MAFSFRQSNMKRILTLPMSAAVFLASMITPRRQKRWVFGRKGMYGGNSRYLMEYVVEHHPEIECIWLAHSEGELEAARAVGAHAVLAKSWRGWWAALTAKVGIVSLGLEDVNRSSTGGMFVVQLWHGLPLKKLGLDTQVTTAVGKGIFGRLLEPLLRTAYRIAQSRYKLVTAPNALVAQRYESAFALRPGRVALTGDPNVDIILGSSTSGPSLHWQSKMRATFGLSPGTRIIMYAPTWREEVGTSLLPEPATRARLNSLLRDGNAHLLIRGHYADINSDPSVKELASNISVMSPSDFPDANYLLSGIDIMISDYSGIIMDFAILKRPIIFFAPDIDSYTSLRGLYERYEAFTGRSDWATNWEELSAQIKECLDDDEEFIRNALHVSSRYGGPIGGSNRERIFCEISRRLGCSPTLERHLSAQDSGDSDVLGEI
jgi:CDP-glycerol glycerophosphotransferase (TagB/SpsB family)